MEKFETHFIGDLFVHIIIKGEDEYNIYENSEDKEKYIKLMKALYLKYSVKIISYCTMENYMHIIVHSEDSIYIRSFLKEVNTRYALYFNRKYKLLGYKFKGKIKVKPILSNEKLWNLIKYIHMNPVKYDLIKKENQYPYSSYNDYRGQLNFINKETFKLLDNKEKEIKNTYKKFLAIKYVELYQEENEDNISKIINEYLGIRKIHIETLKKEHIEIKKLLAYIVVKGYEYNFNKLAKVLNIDTKKSHKGLCYKIL